MSIWQWRKRIVEFGGETKSETRYLGLAGMKEKGRQGGQCDNPAGVGGKVAFD